MDGVVYAVHSRPKAAALHESSASRLTYSGYPDFVEILCELAGMVRLGEGLDDRVGGPVWMGLEAAELTAENLSDLAARGFLPAWRAGGADLVDQVANLVGEDQIELFQEEMNAALRALAEFLAVATASGMGVAFSQSFLEQPASVERRRFASQTAAETRAAHARIEQTAKQLATRQRWLGMKQRWWQRRDPLVDELLPLTRPLRGGIAMTSEMRFADILGDGPHEFDKLATAIKLASGLELAPMQSNDKAQATLVDVARLVRLGLCVAG